ncbi:ABC transporter permease [Catalinimonas niigatensis]|uniref:ABC transporter permease n=1 Tax=Catalinimonas niigatensis TaxID=1397264 RepID=UPI002666B06D|nr:ABC transporter permease [Catalinimonas niigatensis]WPP48815.1 ABC transporter permease [Catalinimonas niigatensis]
MMYKTSLRNLWKNKSHTLINVLGLSLGITCSIVLFLLIRFWLSFDTFHSKGDRIYRLVRETIYQGNTDHTPGSQVPVPDALRTDFPELEEVVFMSYLMEGLVTVYTEEGQPQNFQETEGLVYADRNFFKVFDRPLLQGDPDQVLNAPNQVVIDEELAEKYFGKDWQEQAIVGKVISLNKDTELKITGIAEAKPENTDFPFTMMISYATVEKEKEEEGGWNSISSDDQVYVLLPEDLKVESIEARLPDFVEKYEEVMEGQQVHLSLQPLSEMHFDTRYATYSFNTIPRYVIISLGAVALFMLLIACINFVNLATAIATKRAKEVGIRKALGSSRAQLARIFMTEAGLITLFSLLVALGAAELLLIRMNDYLEMELQLNLGDPYLLLFLLLTLLSVSLLAGSYPTWVLTRFEPTQVLKSSMNTKMTKGFNLRRGLVVFQFVIAQAFIIGTLVLISQTQYIQNADLGFKHKGVVSVAVPGEDKQVKKTLKQELLRLPSVEKVTLAFSSPSSGSVSVTSFTIDGNPDTYHTQLKYVDKDYIDVYALKLLAGTGLSEVDTMSRLVVNESFLSKVGIVSPEEAIGRQVSIGGKMLPIVGVVKDFHTVSLRQEIGPAVLVDLDNYRKADILLSSSSLSQSIQEIEARWKDVYPEYTFDYQFIDEEIAGFYEGEQKMTTILGIAAMIVIFIGCLGLYGLVTYMAEQKAKEVSVRKVLGASVASIVRLFSVEFIRLIVIAFAVAAPIAYFLMNAWLQNFEYKTKLGIGLFAGGILITLLIALLTIGYRSMQAARINPAQALRND